MKIIKRFPRKLWFVYIFLIITLLSLYISSFFAVSSQSVKDFPAVNITFDNLEQQLSKHPAVKQLPDDINILLILEGDNKTSYIISKSNVEQGSFNNPDIIIYLDSKYISDLTSKNYCKIIGKAYKNSDLRFETKLSKTELAWKFKTLIYKYRNYKECIA